jgi:hypothetical protein
MKQPDLFVEAVERQHPVNGEPANTLGALWKIATHPAFRLGFLDAQNGRPFAHDRIFSRIQAETPETALRRIGWDWLFRTSPTSRDVEIAQYRYEEGRLAVAECGCRCKAWGHPDYPPAQVRKLIERFAKERGGSTEARAA